MTWYKATVVEEVYIFRDLNNKEHSQLCDGNAVRYKGRWYLPMRYTGSYSGVRYGSVNGLSIKIDPKRVVDHLPSGFRPKTQKP